MSDTQKRMSSYLPPDFDDVVEMDEIIKSEANEITFILQGIGDGLDQSFVDTATWGLDRWEAIFGLTSNKYAELTWDTLEGNDTTFDELEVYTWDALYTSPFVRRLYDERRGAIKSRIRGNGVVTKAFLKNVVESFTNGEVEIIDDPSHYLVTIKFVSNVGIPPNYNTVKEIVREILPAHLALEFTNEYTIWNDLRVTTWGNLANYTWGDVKGGLWNA